MVQTTDGKIVRDSARIKHGDELQLTFARGTARANVKDKT
jgi:exonuclease VII large subunit